MDIVTESKTVYMIPIHSTIVSGTTSETHNKIHTPFRQAPEIRSLIVLVYVIRVRSTTQILYGVPSLSFLTPTTPLGHTTPYYHKTEPNVTISFFITLGQLKSYCKSTILNNYLIFS